jgi:signal transduction histidine kinase/DNA-binding response OmpR family regulator
MINPVAENVRDRILVVESDPLVADMIARQALQAAGYQTQVVNDATAAINRAIQLAPDAIIVNLDLPGLSGKDLMVALSSQGMNVPVVVLARKGQEADIIQAFRLGAVDYMLWPVREPEIINVVERVLRAGRERKEREQLARQLQRTNQELQARVRELTTIFAIGKAVTSITDQNLLFERILEGATRVTQADLGWFLLRMGETQPFLLVAQRGLPQSIAERTQEPWDDGISSLVALSGESLSIHGEPMRRFKIAGLGQAALIVPVKVQKSVIGLLVVMRKPATPFSPSEQHLLEAVADYASISLVNSRLFRTVEERARSLENMAGSAQTGEKINREILIKVKNELHSPLVVGLQALEKLAKDPTARWNAEQRQQLSVLQEQMHNISHITDAILPPEVNPATQAGLINLSDQVQLAARRFLPFSQQNGLTLTCEVPPETIMARGDAGQIAQVLDGLLSNALKYTVPGGRVMLRLVKTPDARAEVTVADTGLGLDAKQVANLFNSDYQPSQNSRPLRFGGLGVGLTLVKEIVTNQKGKVWVESQPGVGTTFHFTLPASN